MENPDIGQPELLFKAVPILKIIESGWMGHEAVLPITNGYW